MSYPASLDNLTGVSSGDPITSSHENLQTTAVNAIETALGVNPFGPYSTVADAIAGKVDSIYASDGGSANAYAVTLSPVPGSYTSGMIVAFNAANSNTGASTLNVNGLGTQNIMKDGASALITGDILAGQIIFVIYDGTNFQVVNTGQVVGVASGGTGASLSSPPVGALLVGNGFTFSELVIGNNGNSLVADSAQTLGCKWGIQHKMATATKTSNYTIASTDIYIRVNAASNNVTITLPDATTVGTSTGGDWFIIKRIDSSGHTVTVNTTSSQTIDGATSVTLPTQYEVLQVMSNGSNWDVI